MPAASSPAPSAGVQREHDLVCHCRKVPYATVREAIREGDASTLADIQRTTTACTRCFGCRFELERMLRDELGDRYRRTPFVTRPEDEPRGLTGRLRRALGRGPRTAVAKRMYMPVLTGFRGDVRTRVVLFHWHDGGQPRPAIDVRADLLALDGRRLDVWHASIAPATSAILNVDELAGSSELTDGAGTLKLVVDADAVGSLRPYFHLISSGGITSTHEKSSPKDPRAAVRHRGYHWTFPVGAGREPSEAWMYCLNAVPFPLEGRQLAWHGEDGEQASVPLPGLELDQAALVPLHEHFPAVGAGGHAGTVRVTPTTHVAGHILRYHPGTDRWRVQHL